MERLRPPIRHPEVRDREGGRASKERDRDAENTRGDSADVHGSRARTRHLTMTGEDGVRGKEERTTTPFFTNLPAFPPGQATPRHYREPHIELLFKTFRQLILTPPEQLVTDAPDEPDFPLATTEHGETYLRAADERAFMHHIIRSLSRRMGQPGRCVRAACRRNNRCCGEPPDCWPDLPLVETEEQVKLIQYAMKTMFEERLRHDAGE